MCIITYLVILGHFVYKTHKKTYTAEDFGIETIVSKTDFDNDGIDDCADILERYSQYQPITGHYRLKEI